MNIANIGGRRVDVAAALMQLERKECEESLYEFLRTGWKYIDPAPWSDGWAIEAVAEHLQAVVDGDIRRLIINIPPRMGKSSMCSVALPAWTWAQPLNSPTSGPGTHFLHASYAMPLALRDSVKTRRLIQSPWYQKHWGDRFKLTGDQNTKTRFDNDRQGTRLSTAVGAGTTGEGGNIIVIDDPNAANQAFSEAQIEEAIEWWDGTMSTRLNDPKTGAFVIIQQRLAEDDLTGHILSKDVGEWTHLMLPMEYEPERATMIYPNKIGWSDPRTQENELLQPERFGRKEVETLKRNLGKVLAAGQLQQRPVVKGGNIIKNTDWKLWEAASYPLMDVIIASVDTAYTAKEENDYSAMTVWGVFTGDMAAQDAHGQRLFAQPHPRAMLMYAWKERLELHELVLKIRKSCKDMKVDRLIIENKASGISVSQELRRLYGFDDFAVQLRDPGNQDKVARLWSVQQLFSEGMIYAPNRSWAEMVIDEVGKFPKGKHDDLVDTVSAGLRHLRDLGILVRGEEVAAETQQSMAHQGAPPAPLYVS